MGQMGKQFYKSVIVIWLALSIASVVLAVVSWTRLSERLAQGRAVISARDTLTEIGRSSDDAESAERGYIITGDKKFLNPFDQAKTNLSAQFDRLVELVRDDTNVLATVIDLRAQAETKITKLDDDLSL